MFIVTQLIGLAIVSFYNNPEHVLPFGMEPPDEMRVDDGGIDYLGSIFFAFVFAIFLFFILTKINAAKFIRAWFFIVTSLALGLSLNAIFFKMSILSYTTTFALAFAAILAYFKIYKRDLVVHNVTELFIYPGIAAVFVPILNVFGIIILLLAISLYDIWAVWHSEFMQKMASYQINKLKFFTGFFMPYADKKTKLKIKKIKDKYTSKEDVEKHLKKSNVKVSLAILGGGDIIFPIITAGVILKVTGSISQALIISLSATLALLFLFIMARKGKFYPAMPFLTIGMYLGLIFNWLVF